MKSHSLRVAMVSSLPPTEGGIAIYFHRLLRALLEISEGRLSFTLLSNTVPSRRDLRGSVSFVKCWRRNSLFYPLSIFRETIRQRPDIVHVQHEYLLYGRPYRSGLFTLLLFFLLLARKKVVVTMHSVIPVRSLTPEFFEVYSVGRSMSLVKKLCTIGVTKLIGAMSALVVVHKSAAKRELVENYGLAPGKVAIVSHGVELAAKDLDPEACKRDIGLDGGPLVTFFGFVRPGKRIEDAIQALPTVLQKNPSVRLVIAGGCHNYLTPEGQGYFRKLELLTDQLQLRDSVVFTKRFLGEEELPRWLAASDIFLLPYGSDIISSSGVLATVAEYGKPIIVTDIPHFSEVKEEGLGIMIREGDEESFAFAVNLLLSDAGLRRELGLRLRGWAERNSWTRTAHMTMDIYRAVAESGFPSGIKT